MIQLRRLLLACACLPLLTPSLCGQTASTPPLVPDPQQPAVPAASAAPAMLSSRAAYEEAMRPLDLTRRAIGNWSDVEVAALSLAVQQAASACSLRDPLHVPVEELVDLARLCGVGQKWEVTMLAAHRYIEAPQPEKPQLTQAYADAVEAELRLKMGSAAQQTAQEMLAKVPYDAIVSGAYDQALDYLEFVDTSAAVTLAQAAQPVLLQRLGALAAAPAVSLPAQAAPADGSELTPTMAYRDALRLPALQVYLGHLPAAATLAAAVESSLPAQLNGDDSLLIAAERRRFALLGHRLPLVDVAFSLDPRRAPAPELPIPDLAEALLLFPDWCAQCVRMGPQFPEGKFVVGGRQAVFYALLAQTRPSSPTTIGAPAAPGAPPARSAADQLRGTPTLLVPAATLLQLEANDYPLLLLVDENGIVRLHQPVSEDALQAGSTVDSALASLPGIRGIPGAAPAHPAHLGWLRQTPRAPPGTDKPRCGRGPDSQGCLCYSYPLKRSKRDGKRRQQSVPAGQAGQRP